MKRISTIALRRASLGLLMAYGVASAAPGSLPTSRDGLFDDTPEQAPPGPSEGARKDSKESLFGDDLPVKEKKPTTPVSSWRGYVSEEVARTIAAPDHWSKVLTRAEIGRQGKVNDWLKWKASARLDYDAVYALYKDTYPREVRNDQKFNLNLRENYLDVDAGNWDFRLGRQQVVWGEVVGLFFADVVSAKDMREFILPDFDTLRIPQWAARGEYFNSDFHAELLWIPLPTYNETGKPGSNFYPALPVPPGFTTQYRSEDFPKRKLGNSNFGLRLSTLKGGWDISGFYYNSLDASPTFYRQVSLASQPTFTYQARHDRINQFGATFAKDFGSVVLKGEAVYTNGRRYTVVDLNDTDGVARQTTVDWVAGLEFTLPADSRLNLQLFQRAFLNHDPAILPDKYENGFTVLLSGKLASHVEAQTLWIASLNRQDWLLRPSLSWMIESNLRLRLGLDIFKGQPLGFFGQYNKQDRAYTELRYSF